MPFLDAGGHRLEYEWIDAPSSSGSDDTVLVLLHEGLGSVALWKDFPERLAAAAGREVLVYSRYGYGKSDRLAAARTVDYMHREALETLPQVLDALSIRSPVLVGHSDGASIALIHAGTGRRPVRAVVAMAPHVFVEDVTVTSIAQAKVTFETTDLPARLGRYHDDAVSTFRGWNDIWLHPDFQAWNIEEYLPRITVPVLVIQGEDDQYGTAAQVEAIARQVKGPVETLMLSRCAHSPHVDQREATLEAIARFVKSEG
ncbi:MAG TPA: alpha/beta hydrolase [Burkholderiales bacterium]|nr:alpha/beta hydrolase [Burkholderiales bacterium]